VVEQQRGQPSRSATAIGQALRLARGKVRADIALLGARLALEEQGVNTLFLSLGMLHYTEDGQARSAPIPDAFREALSELAGAPAA